MKKVLNLSFTLIIIVLFSACASVGVTVSKSAPAKPKDCILDIYFSSSEIKRSFEVIALIDSKTGSNLNKTVAKAIENAKPKACQCGADAIIVEQSNTVTVSGGGGYGSAILRCIRYTDKK
jgi:hypothetical protein